MTFRRSLRWLLDCAIAAPVVAALALPSVSAFASPDDKPVRSAAKPDKKKVEKTKSEKAKPETKTAKAKPEKKIAATRTAATKKPVKTETKPAKSAAGAGAPTGSASPG